MKKVICAFPGVFNMQKLEEAKTRGIIFISPKDFFTEEEGVYPGNYIDAVKIALKDDSNKIILIDAATPVREELTKGDIPYCNAYPFNSLRIEYIKKMRNGLMVKQEMKSFNDMWHPRLKELALDETAIMKIRLNKGIDLFDIF